MTELTRREQVGFAVHNDAFQRDAAALLEQMGQPAQPPAPRWRPVTVPTTSADQDCLGKVLVERDFGSHVKRHTEPWSWVNDAPINVIGWTTTDEARAAGLLPGQTQGQGGQG